MADSLDISGCDHIVLLTDSFLPDTAAAARLMNDLAAEILARGAMVSVIACDPLLATPMAVISQNGITVLRVRAGKRKADPYALRLVRESLISILALWRLRRHLPRSARLIVTYSPSIFWGPFVIFLRRRFRCNSYLIVRDLFPRWAVEVGLLSKFNPLYWYLRLIELMLYFSADRIGVQAQADIAHVRASVRNSTTVEVLTNWYTPQKDVRAAHFRRQFNLGSSVVFFYGGNLGPAQSVRHLLALARAISTFPDSFLVVVAIGKDVDTFRFQLETDQKRVLILAPLSQSEFEAVLQECDVGIVLLNAKLTTSNIPGKLLGYCGAELAILADVNAGNDLVSLVTSFEAGLVSKGDVDQFVENARQLASNPLRRTTMQQGATRLGSSLFSTKRAASIVLDLASSLMTRK